jgi:uncharacterized damage-inducible protein DinB
MTSTELLEDAFQRVRDSVYPAVSGLSAEELAYRLDSESNSIAWLVWHLTRIQDDHIADLDGAEQAWTSKGWFERFDLPLDPSDTGYGHDSATVALVAADSHQLLGYFEDVHAKTMAFVRSLDEDALDRVVDKRWNPPVTMSVRLVSVVNDDLQHVGQAAYVRGIVQRR